MEKNYYDMDYILQTEDRVPVTFRMAGPGLGYLNPSLGEVDIPQGAKVDIPIWLALLLHSRSMVTLSLPYYLESHARSSLEADPQVMDLGSKALHFFEVGASLASATGDLRLPPLLHVAFVARYRSILDRSQHSRGVDLSDILRKYTRTERNLFKSGHKTSLEHEAWRSGKGSKLRHSSVLSSTISKKSSNLYRATTRLTSSGTGGGGGATANTSLPNTGTDVTAPPLLEAASTTAMALGGGPAPPTTPGRVKRNK